MTTSRTDQELERFARTHVSHEVRMLVEILPLTRRGGPLYGPSMVIARDAASEAFYVHARLLDDFLRDEHDRGRSATAHDYTGTESTRLRPEWLLTVNKQVAHLDWDRGRYPGSEHLQDEILADLRQGLADFYRQLITERQAWFPALRDL